LANSDGDTGTDGRTESCGLARAGLRVPAHGGRTTQMLAPGIRGHPSRRTTAPLPIDDAAQCVNMRTDSTLNPAQ
jgi:hypothetical protein